MRVHIQRGSSIIEVEGNYEDVEKVLDKWWGNAITFVETITSDSESKAPKKASKKTSRRTTNPETNVTNGFDATAVVNAIRNDERFEIFKRKIILGKANRANRAKFVSWFTHETPLTSGNIQKVLQGLGVKVDPATMSRALADAKNDYLRDDSGPQPTSWLTARAHDEYGNWLLSDDDSQS
jgi:hypothetical protein